MNRLRVLAALLTTSSWGISDDGNMRDPTAPINSPPASTVRNSSTAPKINKPQWALGGVLISDEGKKALLNGRWYKERERVDGWELAAIEPAAVVLKRVGRTQRILMFPNINGDAVKIQPE